MGLSTRKTDYATDFIALIREQYKKKSYVLRSLKKN